MSNKDTKQQIIVDMWSGDSISENDHKYIGKRKIDANHRQCYDFGEILFSKCTDCNVWICYSHEEVDHKCEDIIQ